MIQVPRNARNSLIKSEDESARDLCNASFDISFSINVSKTDNALSMVHYFNSMGESGE